jgi:hypothetical protein
MSEPLAERIKSVIETEHRWRSAPLMLGVESRTCTCGITFATTAEHHIHVYEQAAAAARAFIGDEIHEELRRSPGGGALWQTGMYGAESIARGDTE